MGFKIDDGEVAPDDVLGYGYYGLFGFELDQTDFFKRDPHEKLMMREALVCVAAPSSKHAFGHSTVEDKNGLNRV